MNTISSNQASIHDKDPFAIFKAPKKQGRKKKKIKTTARQRYEQQNPAISCRVPIHVFNSFNQQCKQANLSQSAFITKFTQNEEIRYDNLIAAAREEGIRIGRSQIPPTTMVMMPGDWSLGYDTGKNEHGIWFRCRLCGKPVYIKPGSEEHDICLQVLEYQGRSHQCCIAMAQWRQIDYELRMQEKSEQSIVRDYPLLGL